MPGILYEYLEVFRIDFLKELLVLITAFYHYYTVSNMALFAYTFFVVINYIFIYYIFKLFIKTDLNLNKVHDQVYEYLVDCFNNMVSIYIFNEQENENKLFIKNSFQIYKDFLSESLITYIKANSFWAIVTIALFIVMNYFIYQAYKEKKITTEKLVSSFIITYSIIRLYENAERSSKKLASVYSQIKDSENFFNV